MKSFIKLVVIVVLFIFMYTGIAHAIFCVPVVETYTCPCGHDTIVPYNYCAECGKSISEAKCKYMPTCNNCNRNGYMIKYCKYCGSDDIDQGKEMLVKDAGLITRLINGSL